MKLKLIALVALATFTVAAADIRITWVPTPSVFEPKSYGVYQSVNNGPFVKVADVPATTNTVVLSGLAANLYKFRVTVVNFWGENAPSADKATPPGLAPTTTINDIQVVVP